MMNLTITDRFDAIDGTGPGGVLGSCAAPA